MFTLNKLNAKIQEFVSNHKQLKTYCFDTIPSIGERPSIEYPLLFASLNKGVTLPNQRQVWIDFYVADKVREDKTNQTEVLSDTELIVLDILSYFMQTNFSEYVDIEVNNDYSPFTNSFDDNCSGWMITVKFKMIFEWDLCSVPIN